MPLGLCMLVSITACTSENTFSRTSENSVKRKSKSRSTHFRRFIYLKSKRCILVAVIQCLAKLGLQYSCCNLGWKEFCRTYVFPANRNKMESRRADSNRLPLLQLRVITHALQGCAGDCKCRIFRGVSFPCLAACFAFPVVSGARSSQAHRWRLRFYCEPDVRQEVIGDLPSMLKLS